MCGRTSPVEPVSDGQARFVVRMDEDFVREYPGGKARLELAKGHPDIKARTFAFWDQLAKERELMLPLLERGSKFSVDIDEFETIDALVAALGAAGLAYFDPYVRNDLLPRVKLVKVKGSAESHQVTPGDLDKTGVTRRDVIYADAKNLGFGSPVQEYGALLALNLQRQLNETGDCDLAIGKWYVIASEPIVGSSGGPRLLYVSRDEGGVYLYWRYGGPAYEWDPDDQFLFGAPRK